MYEGMQERKQGLKGNVWETFLIGSCLQTMEKHIKRNNKDLDSGRLYSCNTITPMIQY